MLMERRHLTREQTVEVLEQRARAMGVLDFALSVRQLDRWLAGGLITRPRPAVCRVLEAEFDHSVAVLLAPGTEASVPALSGTEVTRTLRTTEFVAWIADHSDSTFRDVYAAVAEAADRAEAVPFAARAGLEHVRASRTRSEIAMAVQDYYGESGGFYAATVGDAVLSLSVLTEPEWIDLALPLMGVGRLGDWFGEAWSSEPSAGEHSPPQSSELYV